MNAHSPSKQRDSGAPKTGAARSGRTPTPDMQADDAGTAASGNDPAQPGEPPLEQAGKGAPTSRAPQDATGPDTQETR